MALSYGDLKSSKKFLYGWDAESIIDTCVQNLMMFPTRTLLKMAWREIFIGLLVFI